MSSSKMGRPTKYKPEYVEIARGMAKLGATLQELADALGVSISSVKLWISQYDDFSAAVRVGREVSDNRVEESLYNRAMGYSHEETDIRVIDGQIVETKVVKYYPPDATAMIFWLKNRRPGDWKDKRETEHSGGLSLNVVTGVPHESDEDS